MQRIFQTSNSESQSPQNGADLNTNSAWETQTNGGPIRGVFNHIQPIIGAYAPSYQR